MVKGLCDLGSVCSLVTSCKHISNKKEIFSKQLALFASFAMLGQESTDKCDLEVNGNSLICFPYDLPVALPNDTLVALQILRKHHTDLCERIEDSSFSKKRRSRDGKEADLQSLKRRIPLAYINSPDTERHTSNATADTPRLKENRLAKICRNQAQSPLFQYQPHIQLCVGVMPPVILRSMLYGIVMDATQAGTVPI